MQLNFNVNKIYYISLEERFDCKLNCDEEFKNFEINNLSCHAVKKHKNRPVVRCLESHIECIRGAETNNYENIIISEDNVKFKIKIE